MSIQTWGENFQPLLGSGGGIICSYPSWYCPAAVEDTNSLRLTGLDIGATAQAAQPWVHEHRFKWQVAFFLDEMFLPSTLTIRWRTWTSFLDGRVKQKRITAKVVFPWDEFRPARWRILDDLLQLSSIELRSCRAAIVPENFINYKQGTHPVLWRNSGVSRW